MQVNISDKSETVKALTNYLDGTWQLNPFRRSRPA